MPTIRIHIDIDKGSFELTGGIDELKLNRRARFFLNDYLDADMSRGDMILVPFIVDVEQNKEKVLTQILEMLERFDYIKEFTETTKTALSNFNDEQDRFKEFSNQAKGIWNDEIDAEKFEIFTTTLKTELPNRRLYDLQLLASFHLAFSQNACNFSVPGAGKTSVVYGAYAYMKSLPKTHKQYVNRLFIIGPLSSFGPWEDEYQECFGRKGDFKRLSGDVPRDERIRHFLSPHSAEITLISYPGVASNRDDIISYLRRHENNVMVVLDEAHKIKNTEGGIWAQAVLSLAKYCRSRVVLTGTPVPNGYEDIYNLYNFIWPDKDIIDYHLFQLKEMSQNAFDPRISKLIDNVSPFFIRITKADLVKYMELPEINEEVVLVTKMGKVQREIYDFLEKNYVDYFENSVDQNNDPAMTLIRARMIRLMQAATNPGLLQKPIEEVYHEQGISNEIFVDDSELIEQILQYKTLEVPAKFEAVYSKVQQIIQAGEKVIIWGIYIQTIKDLQEYLSKYDIPSELLIGEVPIETDSSQNSPLPNGVRTRESIVRDFHNPNSSFKVIIANPFAVAESISLHKACHNAIYLERNFNAATFLQSKDRIHRVGLNKDDEINYYYFLSENSIDQTIHDRLLEKETRMQEILESRDIPLINMNMDYSSDTENDVKALIKDYVQRSS